MLTIFHLLVNISYYIPVFLLVKNIYYLGKNVYTLYENDNFKFKASMGDKIQKWLIFLIFILIFYYFLFDNYFLLKDVANHIENNKIKIIKLVILFSLFITNLIIYRVNNNKINWFLILSFTILALFSLFADFIILHQEMIINYFSGYIRNVITFIVTLIFLLFQCLLPSWDNPILMGFDGLVERKKDDLFKSGRNIISMVSYNDNNGEQNNNNNGEQNNNSDREQNSDNSSEDNDSDYHSDSESDPNYDYDPGQDSESERNRNLWKTMTDWWDQPGSVTSDPDHNNASRVVKEYLDKRNEKTDGKISVQDVEEVSKEKGYDKMDANTRRTEASAAEIASDEKNLELVEHRRDMLEIEDDIETGREDVANSSTEEEKKENKDYVKEKKAEFKEKEKEELVLRKEQLALNIRLSGVKLEKIDEFKRRR